MDDLLPEFLTETAEAIAVIDHELVKFEQDPNDGDILSNIFRLVHTIKGTSGFLGLPRLEKVAHAGEDVLGKIRDGDLEVTPAAVTLILRAIDTIKDILAALEEAGAEPEGDDSVVIEDLRAMAEGNVTPAPTPVDAAAPVEEGAAPVVEDGGFPVAAELLAEVEAAQSGGAAPLTDEEMAAEMEAAIAADAEPAAEAAPAVEEEAQPVVEAKVPVPAKETAPAKEEDRKPKESSVAQQSIRVNVELLENLMTLVSEMVLTRNQLMQMVRGHDDSEFKAPLQRLSLITTDLQEGVMKTRMQPIGNAWAKLPRIVRDLAVESGKQIDLQMVGAETELDRQVLELIKDPLTHMVRNSADHGLETSEGREEAGKPKTGVITLEAFHEGGHIIIRIADDGRGLNMDRIRTKVVENGLASELELEGLTDQQIQQFIFKAGFSTAEKVTSVSGRGVGMDVVRTNIEKIGGTIELKSVAGRGSTFTIKIPLTLAIVSALVIESGGERFAIPQISVLELVRASAHSQFVVERINGTPVLRLRDRLLPLINLTDLLKLNVPETVSAGNGKDGSVSDLRDDPTQIADANTDATEDAGSTTMALVQETEELFIVVCQVGTYTFGIIVDRVFDTEEIVVKPVAPILRHIPFYSGNTILGDGSVIMILDPNGIATATGEVAMGGDKAAKAATANVLVEEKSTMLIFRAGSAELKAVPLALVARLEEIDMATTERSHGDIVVQYRGHLMPLIPFHDGHEWKAEGRQPILVFTDRDRSMGLVVDEIVDIVEDRLNIEIASDVPGMIGSAVIDGKATDVVDAGYYLTRAFADWFLGVESTSAGIPSSRRVLLVDDSPFFRNLLTPILSVAGYTVTTVESATTALKMRDEGIHFDAIISDIEMPDMDGFAFAQAVRSGPLWSAVPMVALSSHSSAQDFERGREAGFNDYVVKSDREGLVKSLAQSLGAAVDQTD